MPNETREIRKVADIAKELRDHPDVISVTVWTVGDVLDCAADWADGHNIVLDKDEWDELERRVRSEGAGRMNYALSGCNDDDWDVVYDYVRVEVDDIVKSRKEQPNG